MGGQAVLQLIFVASFRTLCRREVDGQIEHRSNNSFDVACLRNGRRVLLCDRAPFSQTQKAIFRFSLVPLEHAPRATLITEELYLDEQNTLW